MKKLLFRLAAVFLAVFLTLLLLEIGVRIFWNKLQGPVIPLSLNIHRVSRNPMLGYDLIPKSSSNEDGVRYRINRDGIRDFEYARNKQNGTCRIAAVGDSLTFGMALEPADTWPKQLEAELRRESYAVEVINFGVMGYDTTQETEYIESKVLAFSPDMIIIGYCLNDIGILSRERRVLSQYRGYDRFLSTRIRWLDGLLRHSRLYLLLKNRLYLKKTRADAEPPHFSRDGQKVIQMGYQNFIISAYHEPENRIRLEQAFQKIRRLTDGKIRVIVAIFPELAGFDPYPYSEVHAEIARLAGGYGFEVIDTQNDFLGHDPRKIRISDANLHPNRIGNAIFADAVARFLVQKGLVGR